MTTLLNPPRICHNKIKLAPFGILPKCTDIAPNTGHLCFLLSAFDFALLYSALWCFVHSLLSSAHSLLSLPHSVAGAATMSVPQGEIHITPVHQYTSTRWQSATMILHWFAEIRCVFTSMSI